MQVAIVVAGTLAELAGWWLVATGRFDVWKIMPVVLGAMGLVAVLVRPPVAAAETTAWSAAVVGLASGLALYVGTRVFVGIASRWAPFRRDVLLQYGRAGEVTLATTLVLGLAIMVPAEELFYRGLVQGRLTDSVGAAAAAAGAWTLYVVANLASRSLPIIAGAVVGGAVWSGLAWWSGGVFAGLTSHILWAGLMLAVPPGAGRPAIEEGPAR